MVVLILCPGNELGVHAGFLLLEARWGLGVIHPDAGLAGNRGRRHLPQTD